MLQVHNKHERLAALRTSLLEAVGSSKSFEVSDVKRDGTVIIRFKSVDELAAIEAMTLATNTLSSHDREFTVDWDNVRMRLILP